MGKINYKKEYRKAHKKLIKLAKKYKAFDYEFAIDIFAQCIKMIQLHWEFGELAQDKDAKINEYYENLCLMKEFELYYLQYKNATDTEMQNKCWHNMWTLIGKYMRGWWD